MASIRKNGSKWVVDFYLGRVRKRLTFLNKNEAEVFKRNLLLRPLDKATGFFEKSDIRLEEAAQKYLDLVTSHKAGRTQDLERMYFNEFLKFFGDTEVSDVSLSDLQEFQVHLRKTLVSATINRRFNTIRHFFSNCAKWKFLKENPCDDLENLKEDLKPIRTWNDSQIESTINHAAAWAQAPMRFISLTGARRGEAVSLTWDCVDFENRVIHIRSVKGRGEVRLRAVPITERLFQLLENLPRKSQNVFVGTNGESLQASSLSRATTAAGSRANVPGIGLHGMRHSILTKLAVNDVSLEKIRMLAGHSNLHTTMKYLHLNTEEMRESMESLVSDGHQKQTPQFPRALSK